jgi:hypothetical protein
VRPLNAVDPDDDAVMSAWAARSLSIALRVGAAGGNQVVIDSDLRRRRACLSARRR